MTPTLIVVLVVMQIALICTLLECIARAQEKP